jgi:hypothetical protein
MAGHDEEFVRQIRAINGTHPAPGLVRATDARNSPCGIFRGDGNIRAMKAEGEPVS